MGMSAHAYARSLIRLGQELADVIILSAELDDNADVEIAFKPADPGSALMARAFAVAEQRSNLARAEATVVTETATPARSLVEAGCPV